MLSILFFRMTGKKKAGFLSLANGLGQRGMLPSNVAEVNHSIIHSIVMAFIIKDYCKYNRSQPKQGSGETGHLCLSQQFYCLHTGRIPPQEWSSLGLTTCQGR